MEETCSSKRLVIKSNWASVMMLLSKPSPRTAPVQLKVVSIGG